MLDPEYLDAFFRDHPLLTLAVTLLTCVAAIALLLGTGDGPIILYEAF